MAGAWRARAGAAALCVPRRWRGRPAAGGAVPRPGSPAAPGLAAVAAKPAQEQPAACTGGTARRPRRRGGVPTPTAPGSKGKRVGEDEGLVEKLTTGSNQAEDGRRGVVGVRGGASTGTAMAGRRRRGRFGRDRARPSSGWGGGGAG
jgi:hypothetical protein